MRDLVAATSATSSTTQPDRPTATHQLRGPRARPGRESQAPTDERPRRPRRSSPQVPDDPDRLQGRLERGQVRRVRNDGARTVDEPFRSTPCLVAAPLRMVGARDEHGRTADRCEALRQVPGAAAQSSTPSHRRAPAAAWCAGCRTPARRPRDGRARLRGHQGVDHPARYDAHHPHDAIDSEQGPEQEPLAFDHRPGPGVPT